LRSPTRSSSEPIFDAEIALLERKGEGAARS
jgi:hypothetical protein